MISFILISFYFVLSKRFISEIWHLEHLFSDFPSLCNTFHYQEHSTICWPKKELHNVFRQPEIKFFRGLTSSSSQLVELRQHRDRRSLILYFVVLFSLTGEIMELLRQWDRGRGDRFQWAGCALHFWEMARVHFPGPPAFCHVHLESKWVEGHFTKRKRYKLHLAMTSCNICGFACVDPMPVDQDQYYGFTQFAMELNELDPIIRPLLPPTDTRFRLDQRLTSVAIFTPKKLNFSFSFKTLSDVELPLASLFRLLEEGNVEGAEEQKQRIEQLQRERRKVLEDNNMTHRPCFFKYAAAVLVCLDAQSDACLSSPTWLWDNIYPCYCVTSDSLHTPWAPLFSTKRTFGHAHCRYMSQITCIRTFIFQQKCTARLVRFNDTPTFANMPVVDLFAWRWLIATQVFLSISYLTKHTYYGRQNG